MYSAIALLALVGCVAANPQFLFARANDDGQWHPEFDGSVMGSGALKWGLEDGSWKPEFDGSYLGQGDLTWLHRRKRDLLAVSPYPADEPITALAKSAHLIQQNTEATRNLIGGIPLALPADTPVVAAAKQAHAIAHENQKLATSGLYAPYAAALSPALAAPYAAVAPGFASPLAAPVASPYAYPYAASPYYTSPYLPGLRTIY